MKKQIKKYISLLMVMVMVMVMGAFPPVSFAGEEVAVEDTDYSISGSVVDKTYTITIHTPKGLMWVADLVNQTENIDGIKYQIDDFIDKKIILDENIDFDSTGYDWIPMAGWDSTNDTSFADARFNGTFDGNGKTISNMHIGHSGEPETSEAPGTFQKSGLIGQLAAEGLVMDLTISNSAIHTIGSTVEGSEGLYAGIIAAQCLGDIQDCSIISSNIFMHELTGSQTGIVGGVVGRGQGGQISGTDADVGIYSYVTTQDAFFQAGGFIGEACDMSIIDCSASGIVDASTALSTETIGGFVGHSEEAYISNCEARGDVKAGNGYVPEGIVYNVVGGFVGNQENQDYGDIINSYATGDVVGGNYVILGGFVGETYGYRLLNLYAAGDTTVGSDSFVGGFVGYDDAETIWKVSDGPSYEYYNSSAVQTVSGSAIEIGDGADDDSNTVATTSAIMTSSDFATLLNENRNSLSENEDYSDYTFAYWTIEEGVNKGFPFLTTDDPSEGVSFVCAATNVAGDKITIEFDKDMADPSIDAGNFTVNVSSTETAIGVTISTLNPDTTMIDLILEDLIDYGDTCTVSYNPGTVEAEDGSILDAFTTLPVTNNVVEIDSDVVGAWQIYNHTGNWGEGTFPNGDQDSRGGAYNKHIIIKDSGARITFYGYGDNAFKDFMFLPNDEESTKIFTFDLDLAGANYHSMEGGGFLFNSQIVDGKLSGYAILITGTETDGATNYKLYELDNIDVDAFHETMSAPIEGYEGVTLLGTYNLEEGDLHTIRVEASPTAVQLWDGDVKTIDNFSLPTPYGNGIGLIAGYTDHSCPTLSYFTYNNLTIRGITVVWPIIDLDADSGTNQATLTFTAPTGATNVIVEKSTDGVTYTTATTSSPVTASSISAVVTGLTGGQTYYFRLIVTGGEYAGTSNVATAELDPAPIADLTASGGNGSATLAFTAPTGATGVVVEKSEDGVNFTAAATGATVTATSTSATVTGLTNGTMYTFRLIVTEGAFEGTSNTATATPKAPTGGGGTIIVVPEPIINILRFNIGNVDSFLILGSSLEERKPMDVAPILFEGRTLLPIRFVVEPLGGTIIWNAAEQKVTITRGGTTIELWIGNNIARVNGVDKVIDPDNALVKPIIVNPGRTMLPLRFISEALGCTVDWDAVNKEIMVTNW